MNKLLLIVAILISNIFMVQAADQTLNQQADKYARQMATKLELNEQQFIAVRNLRLAELQALNGTTSTEKITALDEELYEKMKDILNGRQFALLKEFQASHPYIASEK
jgi:predicted Holliday junction resolvase-like endonuclease